MCVYISDITCPHTHAHPSGSRGHPALTLEVLHTEFCCLCVLIQPQGWIFINILLLEGLGGGGLLTLQIVTFPPPTHPAVVWDLRWVFSFLLREMPTLVQNTGPMGRELACQRLAQGLGAFQGCQLQTHAPPGTTQRPPGSRHSWACALQLDSSNERQVQAWVRAPRRARQGREEKSLFSGQQVFLEAS